MRMDPEILDYYDTEVIRRIVEKFGYDEKEAGSLFLSSKTYAKLANPEMGMWQFCPDGIFDMWENERVTGSPLSSVYMRMP